MKGRTFNTANLPVCLIDFNYTRDTNTAKFDSYFRHFGESVIFVFRQTKSKFAHGEWRSLSANPAMEWPKTAMPGPMLWPMSNMTETTMLTL